MKFTYDPEVDALKISWGDFSAYAESEPLEDDVILDYDTEGRVIAVEILGAKERLEILSLDPERELLQTVGPA